jgi:O-antigen/teichoic acid export membrane protein
VSQEPLDQTRGTPPGDRRGASTSIRRNAGLAFFAQVTTGAFTTLLTIYLLRALGPSSYGVFALALSVGATIGLIAEFGIVPSTARFLAENRDDPVRVASLLRDAMRLKLGAAALVSGGVIVAANPIARAYGEPGLTWPLRGIALSLFVGGVFTFYMAAFVAVGHMVENLRLTFFESLAETVASIALVALGAGATGAAFGRAIGYGFGAAVAVVLVVRLYGRGAARLLQGPSLHTSAIARYAAPLLVTYGGYTLYAQIDVLIIGGLLGTAAVALFSAPMRMSMPIGYVGQALTNSVAPRQARAGAERGSVEALQTSLRWLILYQAAITVPLIVWAEPIVELLLGQQYEDSVNVLRVLTLYIFLDGPSRLISTTVNYLGRAKRRIPIVFTALALNIVLDLALLPRIGVVGAAVGTAVSLAVIYVPAHLWICHRVLNLDLGALARTLLRALAASTAMGCLLFIVGTSSLSIADWVLGSVGGVLAFVITLVLTGEITPTEIRTAWHRTVTRLATP